MVIKILEKEIIKKYFPYPKPRSAQIEIIQKIYGAIEKGYKNIILESSTGTGKSAIAITLAKILKSGYIITKTKQLQDQYNNDFKIPQYKGKNAFLCKQKYVSCDLAPCQSSSVNSNFICPYGISQIKDMYEYENYYSDYEIAFKINDNIYIYNKRFNEIDYVINKETGEKIKPKFNEELIYINNKFDFIFLKEGYCDYWTQRSEAIKEPISVLNYTNAIIEQKHVKWLNKRNILILDEAHNIEDEIINFESLKLTNDLLIEINEEITSSMIKKNITYWIITLRKYKEDFINLKKIIALYPYFKKKYLYTDLLGLSEKKLLNFIRYDDKKIVKKLLKKNIDYLIPKYKLDKINNLIGKINNIINRISENKNNWIVNELKNKYGETKGVEFKPITVTDYVEDDLLSLSDIHLFMSATILDYKLFSKWLGLKTEETYYLKIDSEFPINNRPIIKKYAGLMSYKHKNRTLKKMYPLVNDIVKKHQYEKGLIHTTSYVNANFIIDNINSDRFISHNSKNIEEQLRIFKESKDPLIMVTPAMTEGVDLPYDLCEFQIIIKIPFPYLGDKRIQKRMEIEKDWYNYQTALTLIQTYGRGMRSFDDHCITYICDANLEGMLQKNNYLYNKFINSFFKDAIIN